MPNANEPRTWYVGDLDLPILSLVRLVAPTDYFTVDAEVTIISRDGPQTYVTNASGGEWIDNTVPCVPMNQTMAISVEA